MTRNSKKNLIILIILSIIIALILVLSITKEVEASDGYSVIDSQKIFDKSSLDTLKLNITEFPEITVTGNKKYTQKDEDGKRNRFYNNDCI